MGTHTCIEGGRRSCFTLLELLIVIGIMLVILGITVPSFRRMASGNSVNAAARMLTGQLKLARAAAITEQRYIALVMPGEHFAEPGSSTTGKNTNETDDYHFRSFRVAVVSPSGTANRFELVEWYPGASWTFLPVGAVIANVTDDVKNDATTAIAGKELYQDSSNKSIYLVSDKWPDKDELTDSTSDVAQVIDGGSKAELMLADDSNITNDGSPNYARCVVFSPKGRCCKALAGTGVEYVKQYVTIVEGNVDIDGSDYKLAESNKQNMQIIKVSDVTGRCTYVSIGE